MRFWLQEKRRRRAWIPCNAVLSEEDQKYWDDIARKLTDDPDADPTELIGREFKTEGATRMIPDILQNGEAYFFPVFSTVEASAMDHLRSGLAMLNISPNDEKLDLESGSWILEPSTAKTLSLPRQSFSGSGDLLK